MSHQVAQGVYLTGQDAAVLMQLFDAARVQQRGRDDRAYRLLVELHQAALIYRDSVNGKFDAEPAEPDEPRSMDIWTPTDIAKRLDISPRTVRNDINRGLLRATKDRRQWAIAPADATTYLEGRKPA